MRSLTSALVGMSLLPLMPLSVQAADDPAVTICEAVLKADLHAMYWRKAVSIKGSSVFIDYDTISAIYRPVPYVCRFIYDDAKQAFVIAAPPRVEHYKDPFSDSARTAIADKTGIHPIDPRKTELKQSD